MDSDAAILAGTVREGDVWFFPPLNIRASVAGMGAFQAAESWCGIIRNAYKQKEEEREWKTQQAAQEAREASPLERSDERGAEGAGDERGVEEPVESDISAGEETLQEILTKRSDHLTRHVDVLRNQYNSHIARAESLLGDIDAAETELEGVAKALEVACGTTNTPEDANAVGVDIHRQVPECGQAGGGEVGDTDCPEDVPQEASS